MRRQTPVASILYSYLFPTPGPADPPNFQTHLARDLIPEIRIETATFYGSLDSIEARYPGLNYCHGPHRMRLGRFPHHARLFQAIDHLAMTNQEVMDLARWEGTLWARQRFERDEGIKVRDTTGDGIVPWVDTRQAKREHAKGIRIKVETAVQVSQDILTNDHPDCIVADPVERFIDDEPARSHLRDDSIHNLISHSRSRSPSHPHDSPIEEHDMAHLDAPVSTSAQSISRDFNRRILAALAARSQGATIDITPELEAYLKELVESGQLMAASRPADGPVTQTTDSPASFPHSTSTSQQPTA